MNKKILMIIIPTIVLILVIIGTVIGYYILKQLYPKDYSEYVEKYAKEYNVDPRLIYAIIKEESNFNKDANSHKDAIGLMQLVQKTADEVGSKIGINEINLNNPEINIQIGTKYISDLIKKYDGSIKFAIVAYNAGIGNVDKWIRDEIIEADGSNMEKIPFKETNMYLRKVQRRYELYRKLY